ncbi:MAG: PDZ domain-containing protein [Smithellaceae bacterium]|nr:PDZ domain-containing protein [Smithellaceae bacterium]
MKKYILLTLVLLAVIIFGCRPRAGYYYIESNKTLEMPSERSYEFIPTKAIGKETITKGTDKFIDKTNFEVIDSTLAGVKSISISKGGVRVTVAHASFNFLKDKYGLYDGIRHPLWDTYWPILHLLDGAPASYTIDNNQIYQAYSVIPFIPCIMEMYRTNNNKILLDNFNRAFAEGRVQPPNQHDKRTTQEIKSMMEGYMGQPYCSLYYKNNIVFFVKVENLGTEKIKLWPIRESVVIDNTNSQYNALDKGNVKEILSKWESKLNAIPQGKNNPQIGLHLCKKAADKQPDQGSTVYEKGMMVFAVDAQMPGAIAGIKVGDILTEIDRAPNEIPASAAKRLISSFKDKEKINMMTQLDSEEDITKLLSTKVPSDKINVTLLRNGQVIKKSLKLMSADDLPRPNVIRLLGGGNVYPSVVYDGFLVFDTAAMLNNYQTGSTIKLIIPLIGTRFDAADLPVRSYEYEFEFKLE